MFLRGKPHPLLKRPVDDGPHARERGHAGLHFDGYALLSIRVGGGDDGAVSIDDVAERIDDHGLVSAAQGGDGCVSAGERPVGSVARQDDGLSCSAYDGVRVGSTGGVVGLLQEEVR